MQGSHEIDAAMQRSCVSRVGCAGWCGALRTAAPLVPRQCNGTFGANAVLLEPVLYSNIEQWFNCDSHQELKTHRTALAILRLM